MNKDVKVQARGGGVVIAKEITKIRQVIDRQGNVIQETVQKPNEPRTLPVRKPGMNERHR